MLSTAVYGNFIDELIQYRDETLGRSYYAHQDDLFSVIALTGDSGSVVQRYEYGDYGSRTVLAADGGLNGTTEAIIPRGFTGRLHVLPALIEYRHRWMDPGTGRFVQRDPAAMARPGMRIGASMQKAWQYADGPNLYRYARSNPAKYADWNGMAAHTVSMAVTEDDLNGNQTDTPLYITNPGTSTCSVEFRCDTVILDHRHCYLVITNQDGSLTEVRAGPLNNGKGGSSSSSNGQVAGDPCGCGGAGGGGWGPVVPYIGPHNENSPDGNLEDKPIKFKSHVPAPTGMNDCGLANCIMQGMNLLGNSCQDYVLGIKWSRNSNTAISTVLAICGATDPKPGTVDAPGWGEPWYR